MLSRVGGVRLTLARPTALLDRYHGAWWFIAKWVAFTGVTGYHVWRAVQVPLHPGTPRAVYTWFLRAFRACFYIGIASYVVLMLEMMGLAHLLPIAVAQWAMYGCVTQVLLCVLSGAAPC